MAWAFLAPVCALLGTGLVVAVAISGGRLRAPVVAVIMPFFARLGLRCFGVEVEMSGLEHVAERRPRVLVLNHSSTLDMFLFSGVNPPAPCPVGKASLKWIFPLNLPFWGVGMVFLDRGNRERAVASLRRAGELIRVESRSAMISPEGTRSLDGTLGRFKSGAFHLSQRAQAEIVPVVIHGAWALCPPGSAVVRPGKVRVEVKPPLPPSTDPAADALALHARYVEWLRPAAASEGRPAAASEGGPAAASEGRPAAGR
jgi:1-acyl-sn-glycerol-3-phosphate acyltransferase